MYRPSACLGGLLLAALGLFFVPADLPAQQSGFLGKSLSQWREDLTSRDARVRRAAAFALGKSGGEAVAAVPRLVHTLRDPVPAVREAAAYALGEIGPTSWEQTLPSLLTLLTNDEEPLVRRSAAYALGQFGKNLPTASPEQVGAVRDALAKALSDSDAAVRQNAAWAVGRLGTELGKPAVPALARALQDADALVRRDTARALGDLGPGAHAAVPAMVRCFNRREEDPAIRKTVLHALVRVLGPEDRAAAAELKSALTESDPEIVRTAALALGCIGGSAGAPAVPVLCEILQDPESNNRAAAAAALARIGRDAAPAVPTLDKALADRSPVVRRNAALALARIGPKAEPAMPNLIRLLTPEQPDEVRLYAMEALAFIGPAVEAVIPDLLRVLKDDSNWRVRQRAVMAIGRTRKLDGPGILPAFEAVLATTDEESALVRYETAILLGIRLGPRAPDKTIDLLEALLKDPSVQIYTGASASIRSAGQETGKGSSTVTPKHSGDARWRAAQALGHIGPKAARPEILRLLEEGTESADPDMRDNSTYALRVLKGTKQRP
jgi:HEAT repeat protein